MFRITWRQCRILSAEVQAANLPKSHNPQVKEFAAKMVAITPPPTPNPADRPPVIADAAAKSARNRHGTKGAAYSPAWLSGAYPVSGDPGTDLRPLRVWKLKWTSPRAAPCRTSSRAPAETGAFLLVDMMLDKVLKHFELGGPPVAHPVAHAGHLIRPCCSTMRCSPRAFVGRISGILRPSFPFLQSPVEDFLLRPGDAAGVWDVNFGKQPRPRSPPVFLLSMIRPSSVSTSPWSLCRSCRIPSAIPSISSDHFQAFQFESLSR